MSSTGHFLLTLLATLLLFSATAHAADLMRDIEYGGMKRDYIVHTPPQLDTQSTVLPVLIALHGGGGSAKGMQQLYGLDTYADHLGYIVVYPDGVPSKIGNARTWNAGGCCGRAERIGTDDTGFISRVIDAVVKEFHADAKHVFVTGHSNGAMMAYRLACEIPGKIAAIAPVGAQDIYHCPLMTPVPVIHIHGTLDLCALYEGGECGGCFGRALDLPIDKQWACSGVRATMEQRAVAYGCSAETRSVMHRGAIECEEWKGCPSHGEVGLCTIRGAGHHWQGADLLPFCKDKENAKASDLCGRWLGQVGPIVSGVDTDSLIFGFFAGYLDK